METEAPVNAVGDQIPDADLHHRNHDDQSIHLQGFAHEPGTAVEHGQLAVNLFIPLFRMAAQVELMKEMNPLVQELVRKPLANAEQEHQADKSAVAEQPDNGDEGEVTHTALEKSQAEHHHHQGIEHHDNLIDQGFHSDNGACGPGIHAQLVHGINLHGLAAGREGRQGAVEDAHHADTERVSEPPLGIDELADQVQGKPLQHPVHGRNPQGQEHPPPRNAVRQFPDRLNTVGEKQESNQNNGGNGNGNNGKKIFTKCLFQICSHIISALLFQTGIPTPAGQRPRRY